MNTCEKVNLIKKMKRRRKAKSRRWSRPTRAPFIVQECTRLPTRETLTYAEAQKFVDVEIGGQIHRLNICENLEITDQEVEMREETDTMLAESSTAPSICIEDSCSMFAMQRSLQPSCTVLDDVVLPQKKSHLFKMSSAYIRCFEKTPEELDEEVEYDVDEEDIAWLKLMNKDRRLHKLVPVTLDSFETIIDRLEKESYSLTVADGCNQPFSGAPCGICLDSESHETNAILICDNCNLAVHQDCYGVPFLPEGQWICRKCLKSPNTPVACCLCPSKEGAMKQTDDGRWVHMVCAFWIPEVSFSSSVYLEPVEQIDQIPAFRYKMLCVECKERSSGASIQCQDADCTNAFHVTCAQKAGAYMKMERVQTNGSRMNYCKTFYCSEHRPDATASLGIFAGISSTLIVDENSLGSTKDKTPNKTKSKRSKKVVVPQPASQPVFLPLPTIPPKRLINIGDNLTVRDKHQMMTRIHCYWLLKRQSRNGLPLIQRLQHTLFVHHAYKSRISSETMLDENGLKFLKKLRQDIEKVRLLLELVRKREKLKCEMLRVEESVMKWRLQPFAVLLHRTLDQMQSKDPSGIFAYPVSVEEVPDYLTRIKNPMDYDTMRNKIDTHDYKTVEDFEADFQLIIDNCLTYNDKSSLLYKLALKHREQCTIILSAARRMSERANFCPETGLHKPRNSLETISEDLEDNSLATTNSDDINLDGKDLETDLKEMLKRLDVMHVVSSNNSLQAKRLRKQISVIKRRLTLTRRHSTERESKKLNPPQNHCNVRLVPLTSKCDGKVMCIPQKCTRRNQSLDESFLRKQSANESIHPVPAKRMIRNGSARSSHSRTSNNNSSVVTPRQPLSTFLSTECRRLSSDVVINSDHRLRPSSHVSHRGHQQEEHGMRRNSFDRDSIKDLSFSIRLNGCSASHDSSSVTTRSASRRMSVSSLDLPMPSRMKLRHTSSVDTRPFPLPRSCARFHMTPPTPAAMLSESMENDSSYESSYSMDSDTSKCDSPDIHIGLQLFCAKKKTRSNCSMEAEDTSTPIFVGDLVWGKSKGYPWYPALVINPDRRVNGSVRSSFPLPPDGVLELRPKSAEPMFLIRFFDKRRNWQWLPRNKLDHLGVDTKFDLDRIAEIKQNKLRSDIKRAFDEALKTLNFKK